MPFVPPEDPIAEPPPHPPAPTLTSDRLASVRGVRHGFFTRAGGVSQGLYAELNVGRGSHDEPAAVEENRRRAAAAFGLPAEALLTAHQIHSAVAVGADAFAGGSRPQADAVVLAAPGLLAGALAADCAPVLLADGPARVVAAAHAGWRGALGGIVEATVAAMEAKGARRDRIVAAVGPCIGPRSYEVGADFRAAFDAQAPWAASFFGAAASPGKLMFDLPGFVLAQLRRSGVEQVEALGRDTYAEPELFFSNRRAAHRGEGDYGRLLSAVALEA